MKLIRTLPYYWALILVTSSLGASSYPIVEQALALTLPEVHDVSKEADALAHQAFLKIVAGSYSDALEVIVSGMKQLSGDFLMQGQLATILGDYSAFIPDDKLRERMVTRSKEIFEKLMTKMDVLSEKQNVFWFRNEYYFRHAQYENQYLLGLERFKANADVYDYDPGYYSQGVGAANYAKALLLEGKEDLALEYAQKALIAWAQFFTYNNTYYNAYVHYALALGILGQEKEMMRALNRGAYLIQSDLSYKEFEEVLTFVKGLKNSTLTNKLTPRL